MKPAWLLAVLLIVASCATVAPQPQSSSRAVRELSDGWQFVYRDGWTPEEASASTGGWEAVTLPHSWNRLGEYREERTAATDNRQGTGSYRRTIDGAALDPVMRHFAVRDSVFWTLTGS